MGCLLFLGAGIVLYRGVGSFNSARDDLKKAQSNLDRYYKADAFPSKGNVARELENAKQADAWFDDLMVDLSKGNVASDERSPSKFIGAFEAVQRRLTSEARKTGTELPGEVFPFGFERYSGTGVLPNPQDVPRLTEQLVIANRLCGILFKHRIKMLSKLERQEFEDAAEGASSVVNESNVSNNNRDSERRDDRRRGGRRRNQEPPPDETLNASANAGIIREGALYAHMHFALEFRAKQDALLDILNALAAHPMFIVVTAVKITKPVNQLVPDIKEVDENSDADIFRRSSEGAEEQPVEPLKLGPRYPVCGIKMEIPLDVRLELDVFKFKEMTVDSGD